MRALALFDQAMQAAIPSVASVPEFLQGCRAMGVASCQMVPYCAGEQVWMPNAQMTPLQRKFVAAHYLDQCGSDLSVSNLDQLGQSYQQEAIGP